MPRNQTVFWLSVAFLIFGLILLLVWPFIACSRSRCAYFNCGLWITGRILVHISFITAIVIFGWVGAFVTVTGYLEFNTQLFWNGIAVVCVAGSMLVIYLVLSLIVKVIPRLNYAKWCFEYDCEDVPLWKFNLAYGLITLGILTIGCIMFGANFTNNIQVSASHELLETIMNGWSDTIDWFGSLHYTEIADFCQFKWDPLVGSDGVTYYVSTVVG
jgi:hypothetical protein